MQELEDFKPLQPLDGSFHMDPHAGNFIGGVALRRCKLNVRFGLEGRCDEESTFSVDIFFNVRKTLNYANDIL